MGYFEKKCEIILFRSLTLICKNTPKIISIGPPIMEKQQFKKMKIVVFLAPFISKTKRAGIFSISSVKYFDKRLSFWKIWHMWVNHCWNYGPSNLLFHFTQLVMCMCMRNVHDNKVWHEKKNVSHFSVFLNKNVKYM